VRVIVVVFVKLPDVPVRVTVTVPVAAVPLAVSVNVLVLTVLLGLNDAVTPLGRPDADKLTLPLKPFCEATVMVLAPLAPCVMLRLLGDAERVKLGGGVTVKERVVPCDKPPDVPVMVTVAVPIAAVLLAVSVNVLVLVVVLGLNDAVTPLGRPDADKLTLPLKPFCGATVMVLTPLAPCVMLRLLGDAERVKFLLGFTVRETVVVFVKLPDEPVTVTLTVPVVAVPVADRVKRLLVVAGFVPKMAVTPVGRPDTVKFTLPLNPFRGLIVMAVEPAAPWRRVKLAGDAETVKPGCCEDEGQLLIKLAALIVPMPVAKSQPVVVP
jgi:hypothetical protein